MSDDKVKVEITADGSGLQSGMAQAKSAVEDALSGMESTFKSAEGAIGSSIESIGSKLMSLGPAALAAAAAFAAFEGAKAGLEAFAEYGGQVERLSETLGMSTEAASDLSGTLKVLGMSSDTYMSIMVRLDRQLKQHESTFNELGVAVRDANGAFLPQAQILENSIDKIKEYKAGADQMEVAMALLGPRGAEAAFQLMHMKEAEEIALPLMKELGLEMSGPATAAARQFEMQTNALGLAWDAIKVQIGEALIPAITGLMGVFRDLAGPVILAVVDGLKILMSANQAAASMIAMVWDAAIGILRTMGDLVALIAMAVFKAAQGDFKGAWEAIKNYGTAAYKDLNDSGNQMINEAVIGYEKIKAMWSKSPFGTGESGPTSGNKSAPNFEVAKKPPSQMREFEEELKARQVAEQKWDGLSVEEEKAFWETKLAIASKANNDYIEVLTKIQDAVIKGGKEEEKAEEDRAKAASEVDKAVLKQKEETQKQEIKLQGELLEAAIKGAEEEYKARADEISKEYELGKINVEQRKTLLLQASQTELAAVTELMHQKVDLYAYDTQAYNKALQERLKFVQSEAQREQDISAEAAAQERKNWQSVVQEVSGPFTSALQTVGKGILDLGQKGQTFGQVMLKAVQQLVQGFEQLIENIAMAIAKQMLYNALGLGNAGATGLPGMVTSALGLTSAGGSASGAATLTAAGTTLNAAGVSLNTAAATLSTAAASLSAGGGGGGAFSLLGDLGDLAMFKQGGIVSAAGGWSVPSGVGGGGVLSLLHKREVVLPEELGDRVRAMTDPRRGGRGGNSGHTFNIVGTGPKDIAAAVKLAMRMGHR